jgi:hypothetical protein
MIENILNSIKNAWKGIKWFFTEIMHIYSSQPSFFSKKRIESGIAFFISQWGMVYWLLSKVDVMTTSDFAMWAGIELAAAGYIITQIQKEKIAEKSEDTPINEN